MYLPSGPHRLCNLLLLVSCLILSTVAADSSLSRTVTVYAWPLTAPSPSPYLEIQYDPSSLETAVTKTHAVALKKTAKATDDTPPLVRVGLWDAASKTWRGTVTAASTLDDSYTRKVSLHVDGRGEVWHVAVHRSGLKEDLAGKGKKGQESKAEEMQVELVRPRPAPAPALNEPVLLDERGRTPVKEPEKSFLQRYWWIFLAVAFLALAGGGDK